MCLADHFLFGSLRAQSVLNYYSAQSVQTPRYMFYTQILVLAFISHFLADAIPHYDSSDNRSHGFWHYILLKSIPDFIVGTTLCINIFFGHIRHKVLFQSWIGLWAGAVAFMPDVILSSFSRQHYLVNMLWWPHHIFHARYRPGLIIGMASQIIFAWLMCWGLERLAQTKSKIGVT